MVRVRRSVTWGAVLLATACTTGAASKAAPAKPPPSLPSSPAVTPGPRLFATAASALADPTPAPGCDSPQFTPELGRRHLKPGESYVYRPFPPTSGPHDPDPLAAGWLDAPLTDQPSGAAGRTWAKAVHSLEHGYVVVLHRGLTQAQLVALRRRVGGHLKVLVAPEPGAAPGITMLAWGVSQRCHGDALDGAARFVERYYEAGSSPEPLGP